MQELDKARFMIALNLISMGLGSAEISKPKLSIYFEALHDLRVEAIEQSAQEIIKHEAKFPVPKIIRDYANKVSRQNATEQKQISANIFDHRPASEFGKASLALIKKFYAGKLAKKDYLYQAILLTERNGQDASELQSQWRECDA
jgi:hypothetical protein